MVGGALDGRFVIVHSYGKGSPQEPTYGNRAEITLDGGVPATIVATPAFGSMVTFVCTGVVYGIASLSMQMAPASSDVNDARRVANLMVVPLDCPT